MDLCKELVLACTKNGSLIETFDSSIFTLVITTILKYDNWEVLFRVLRLLYEICPYFAGKAKEVSYICLTYL